MENRLTPTVTVSYSENEPRQEQTLTVYGIDKKSYDEYQQFRAIGTPEHYAELVKAKREGRIAKCTCAECNHLEIINEEPIYAMCRKHGITFRLWEEDTRTNFCNYGERREGE